MNTSAFRSAVTRFETICDTLYYELGIVTMDELKESEFYSQYWLASYELAKAMVMSPVHHGKIQMLNALHACDDEDMIQEITGLFIKKYNTIIKALSTYDDFNHKRYASAIVSSFLMDLHNKYVNPKSTVQTADGKKEKKTYSFSSLDTNITNEDSTASYINLLPSNESTPEEKMIAESEKEIFTQTILKIMEQVADHKSKGEVLSLVLYGLKAESLNCSIKKWAQELYNAGPDNFTKIYKRAVLRYNRAVLHASEKELELFLNYSLEDFGRFDMSSPESISLKLSHWNSLLAHELDDYLQLGYCKSSKGR